jgi:TetR/AcrR family transcriptional regulator, transcriptional repressor for nem operon
MKKSKIETAETRRRIVKTAAAEFRRKGINGAGVNDVMAAAGLCRTAINWGLIHFRCRL